MPKQIETIPESDQWKLDGRCSLCRKAKYCKKACSARKRGIERIVDGLVCDLFPKILNSRY
jgi:hypothetical protein